MNDLSAPPATRLTATAKLWQPDLFSRAPWGPMRTITDPEQMRPWLPQLRVSPELLVSGEGSPGPDRDWTISLWFRHSANLNVCVLAVRDEWLDDDETCRQVNLGAPRACLMYLYPTTRNRETLARWLVRDYLDLGYRGIDTVDEQGAIDLSELFDDWIKEE